ncbi:MAG: SsrA-binding protein [Candidatus Moranbacteria bacterium RIFCSPHIGHO2_01_FULL_55_24]|nr:MAG: SsrA-binding protein [Candidatus Moranbacteria bacterium RIFCSPHIGHO2_01_FULL_55_24]
MCHSSAMTVISTNKRASFDYDLGERFEAGLVLTGSEVKSVKTGHASLKGSFVTVRGEELFLTNALIPRYKHAHRDTKHEDTRPRRLLLRKREIRSLIGKSRTEGLTLVPIRLYTKKQLVKLEFAVGKGKKAFDKRSSIAKREADRTMKRALRRHQ